MMKKAFVTLAAILTIGVTTKLPAQAAPVTLPDGTVFDPEFYAEANPDVVQAWSTDAVKLYQHYAAFGKAEGRLAYADLGDFDAAYYAEKNPDVVAVIGNSAAALYQHYITVGKNEGREARDGAADTTPAQNITPAANKTEPAVNTTPVPETTPAVNTTTVLDDYVTVADVGNIIIPYLKARGIGHEDENLLQSSRPLYLWNIRGIWSSPEEAWDNGGSYYGLLLIDNDGDGYIDEVSTCSAVGALDVYEDSFFTLGFVLEFIDSHVY